ncbi:glutathione S-transferase [Sporothrix brasiliensis 5110]|uniref:Glutathione S-transferase n=1 Tax=Sporothrix brasiliensis 5110 TaxID=1398154 RepID=A0A0C2EMD9_9PEZI|nr:glutathione S-transferase [Sporothrix brasiliensis 5110]KIH87249.1 glutathione S-transferase [Sporothrix brasiliensis 5110]
MADVPRPTGTIATKGIELFTLNTPNGYKESVLLEELKDAYGIDYTWQLIDISKNIQKEPWFTALNPNGRIPVIVDHDRNDLAVFEGAAILNYLVARFDKDHKFSFDPATEPDQVAIAESWIAWQHGGLGPMQGQANHFLRYALDKQSHYAVQRYVGETERLYGVLNTRLADRDFIAGAGRGKYSIADIAAIGWASGMQFAGVDVAKFPNVVAWVQRVHARPATARGFTIPKVGAYTDAYRETRLQDPEAAKKEEASLAFLADAQKQFNYKYTSP